MPEENALGIRVPRPRTMTTGPVRLRPDADARLDPPPIISWQGVLAEPGRLELPRGLPLAVFKFASWYFWEVYLIPAYPICLILQGFPAGRISVRPILFYPIPTLDVSVIDAGKPHCEAASTTPQHYRHGREHGEDTHSVHHSPFFGCIRVSLTRAIPATRYAKPQHGGAEQ